MNTKLYWKNRIPFFLLNVLCMLALSFFLFATGSSRNVAGHQDPGFDLLLAQSQTAPDTRQAAVLCDQCEGMLLEQAVAVPLFTQQGYCAMAAGLEGLDYRSDRILFAGASRTGG